ncbi:DUF4260 domain-containing protein [Allomuricauda sp. F6463D]|uniref:DUF4260 domain-containing protein n=1 Tax=Allomuricauda sp. F6463D TaxID=2926409 RepID=UPI001FF3CB21|nr:DUF4260 domain-containing protein [Muricauda sp. F6463D]MCK0160835.1 DUF4260 domain-containing protein [Muricauda sp. F6463D]
MKTTLKLEELMMFILGIYLFNQLDYAWWWFLVLLLTPDIGMLGYLFGNRTGAIMYNLFHHKGIAVVMYFVGIYFSIPLCQFVGIILFSHASLDRMFGYGLKYDKGFKFTHLGEIGT